LVDKEVEKEGVLQTLPGMEASNKAEGGPRPEAEKEGKA
jgi:hypothetical protein